MGNHVILFSNAPEIYTVRKFYEMSTLSVSNFVTDVKPLVGF